MKNFKLFLALVIAGLTVITTCLIIPTIIVTIILLGKLATFHDCITSSMLWVTTFISSALILTIWFGKPEE